MLVGVLCGIGMGCSFSSETSELPLGVLIRYLAFGEFEIGKGYVFYFLKQYFPYLIFQAIWGTYLYQRFCTGCVYYFSRLQDRSIWYWKEIVKLFFMAVSFLVIYIGTAVVTIGIKYGVRWETTGVWMLLLNLEIQVLWLYTMTLLTNLFSIRWGSSSGYIMIASVVFMGLCYFVLFEDVLDFSSNDNLVLKSIMVKINPISHIVLKWHSSDIKVVNTYLRALGIDFSIWGSMVLLMIGAIIASVYGENVIKKQEFIVLNRETGGTL